MKHVIMEHLCCNLENLKTICTLQYKNRFQYCDPQREDRIGTCTGTNNGESTGSIPGEKQHGGDNSFPKILDWLIC